jgi:serine/threonine-protein kinase
MTLDVAHALVGTVLDGSYRIEGLLGEGGMGAVYAATHLRLEKPVAVKVMARELTANPEALARFRREALVTSGLGHPHIVQVFDFSTTPTGEPFLVMEFLDGEDLDHRLRRVGRLPAADVVRMVKQVASALMTTHNKGIVHRDLKPANIYLLEVAGETDFVKVLDFGISKVRSASTKLTRTSSVMGTPNYMSPEQAKGNTEAIDERTDQWALACIAWECLSGQGPFVGENVPSILFQIVHEPPSSLLPKVAGLHPQVEEVLLRGLAKNKNDRFAKVDDFAAALEAALTGKVVPSVSRMVREPDDHLELPPARSKAWIWGAVFGAVAILVVGGILLFRSGASPKPVVATPPAAAAVEPAPLPVAAPPTVPVVPSEQPEIKPESPPPSPKPLAESKPRKPRRAVAPAPSGAPSDDVRSVPAPPPAEKSEKGIQDKWRLD